MIKTKSGLGITIRQETQHDRDEVNALVDAAFSATHDGVDDTMDYLIALRGKDTYVPGLAFVAALPCGKIAGQITLCHTDIITETGRVTQLVLSPVSVLPVFSGRGIAREMITHALATAKEMGYKAVFLQGDPKLYARFGFEPAYRREIYHQSDKTRESEYCMVNRLIPGGLDGITGETYYE